MLLDAASCAKSSYFEQSALSLKDSIIMLLFGYSLYGQFSCVLVVDIKQELFAMLWIARARLLEPPIG